MLDILKWMPGSRTYILAVLALAMALLLQADSQGLFTLAPMLRLVLTLGLTLVIPLVPIYIRKAITNMERTKNGLMPK